MDLEPKGLYDNYVSLGSTCEVAFQLRRVLGKDRSGFFNWNITQVQSLLSFLAHDFSGILQPENLRHSDGNLFHDATHNYWFHADFSRPDLNADGLFESKLKSLREKSEHFLQRFRTLSQRGRTVFFYRTNEGPQAHENMIAVRDLLTRYVPIDRFDLVIALPKTILVGPYSVENIHFRHLARLAPGPDASDGHVSSWDKIFSEFPHRDGLRLAGY